METISKAEKVGEFFGNVLSAFVFLAFCSWVLSICWNYALVNCTTLAPIKFWESILVIIAYRAITSKVQFK